MRLKKKTSLELATWLFLSNAPLTVRYVYDGASYCTYTVVLPPFRFYRAYLKILLFPFYKAQFGCPQHMFRFQGALNHCMQVLREN